MLRLLIHTYLHVHPYLQLLLLILHELASCLLACLSKYLCAVRPLFSISHCLTLIYLSTRMLYVYEFCVSQWGFFLA